MSHALFCSFCGKSQNEVRKLIAGPCVFICDECVGLCNEIIEDEKIQPTNVPPVEFDGEALSKLHVSLEGTEAVVAEVMQRKRGAEGKLRRHAADLSKRFVVLRRASIRLASSP